MLNVLKSAGLVLQDGDSVRFAYKYAYYYYAAKHIQTELGRKERVPDLMERIDRMSREIHVDDNANIILFVLYLTKSEDIALNIIRLAGGLYADVPACRMEEDVRHIQVRTLPSAQKASHPSLEREARRRSEDEAEHRDEDESKDLEAILKINTAVRTREILGQLLRNSPGSLSADLKGKTLTACYSLGLRIIAYLYNVIDQIPQAEFAESLRAAIRGRFKAGNRELTEREVDDMVNGFVNYMHIGLAINFIKRISSAVGSKYLTRTYQGIVASKDASISVRVIDAIINLAGCWEISFEAWFLAVKTRRAGSR